MAVVPSATVEQNTAIVASIQTESNHTGRDYFAANQGDDSNPGTAERPFETIAKGVSVLQPGDTLYIKSGKYVQKTPLTITISGSAASPITIATAPGEPSPAIISGDANGDGSGDVPAHKTYAGLVNLRGSYLHFQNLEVAYSGERGIQSNGKFNTISGNLVHHTWNIGIYVYASDNVVEKNTVWRAADSNWCNGVADRRCNGDWAAGIAWGGAHDLAAPGGAPRLVVRNNTVFNTSGEGILCMHTDNGLIEGNLVYDNWALNIDLDQCSYTIIQKNLVYYTADTIWWKSNSHPSAGIMLSNEGITDKNGQTYPVGHDRNVINNILVGNGVNFTFWNGDRMAGAALVNDLIANNTLVTTSGTGGIGMRIDTGSHKNTRIVNNLIQQSNADRIAAGTATGIIFSNNLWSKTPPLSMNSSTDVIGDPFMVDPNHIRAPGSTSADWYKVNPTSPAINKAMKLPEVAIDYWNIIRGPAPDMGANEAFP